MATFLDDLSIYNAKAAAAITLAATTGDSGKANLMSSLKSTANDTSLTEEVRLNALTALINVGNLLDIPLPPYFPITTTFANTQTYTGLHNDLIGLDVEPYLHITTAEKSFYANKANLSDISFTNLLGAYTSNAGLTSAINAKQNALNGTGFVKASGGTITYDNSTYLTSISGIVAGGDLDGTYPNPTLRNTSVTGQALTGFNGSASTGTITGADTILSAFETLNANVDSLAASSGTITSVSFALPSSVFSYTAGPFTSGAANLSGTFVNQSQNRFFAGPSSGGAGQPTFRAIVAGDFPVSGATAGTYGSSSSIPVVQVDAYGRVTNISSVASASGGQVNTITYSVPAGVFTGTAIGSSIVAITLGLSTQTANTVWAGPASGVDATPGFRSLVALDIPNIAISQVTNLQNELDSKMTFLLNDGEIWIGNASNAPTNQSLTGDVTMTRDGVVTIENEAVTFAKMQNITSGNLLGRWDASTPGVIQQISLSADFDLDSGTGILSLAVPVAPILNSKGGLITYRQSIGQQVQLTAVFDGNLLITDSAEDDGLKWVTAQGDIEVDGALDGTFNITAGAVTLAKMANLAANSFIGNNTGSSATPIALTVTQATAMLNQFTTSAKGLVPAASFTPVSPNTLADYFLNAAGGWSLGGGGGGGGTTTYPLTIGTGLSGTSATFNGSAAVTVSLNTAHANTWTALQTFENNIYLGAAGGTSGSVRFRGGTSGYVALQAAGTTANQTYILPTANGTTGEFLKLSDSGTGQLAWDTAGTGTVTSVGLTMPSAFTVTPSTTNPITTSGTFAITGAGTVAQYVRGDGTLANFPASGGGGASLSYYLNGSVTQFGTYKQMNRVPVNGLGTNFTLNNTTGYALMAQFVTNANDPSLLNIPAGAWDIGFYFSSSNNTGSPAFYVELLKYDGTTFTPIANNSANVEIISNGTAVDLYNTSLAVPSTSLTLTDRLVVRVYVDTAGSRTITFHTEDNNLAQIITTFTTGLTALNGLTAQVQFLANGSTGTAPAFVSSTATHTLNIPLASASSVTAGLISKTEYDTFNGKLANVLTTAGDLIYSSSGTTAARLGIGTTGQVLSVVGGVPAWSSAGSGDVTSNTTSTTTGNFAVFADGLGKTIGESAGASLSAAGAAVFNSSVTVGVSASTTGQLIFRNATTSATTTLLASTSQSANIIYTWPITAPTAGQILSSDVNGNLSWTAAGSGDMTLAGVQTVTGAKTFGSAGNVGKLILAGTTSGTTVLNSGAAAGSSVLTLPVATSTLACLGLAQTFTAAQTFQAGIALTTAGTFSSAVAATFSAGLAVSAGATTLSTAGSTSTAQLTFSGITNNWISFGTNGSAAPQGRSGTRSAGLKIAILPSANLSATADYGIGMESGAMWLSGDSGGVKFYGVNQNGGAFTNLGQFQASTVGTLGGLGGVLGLNLNASTTSDLAPLLYISGGNLTTTYNWISFGQNSLAPPATGSRSIGTKIALWHSSNPGGATFDAGFGVESGVSLWLSSPANIRHYVNSSNVSSGQWAYGTATNDTVRGLHLNSPASVNNTESQLLIAGTGSQSYTVSFGLNPPLSAPTAYGATRGTGKKIVLQETANTFGFTESAIGRETGYMWLCDPGGIRFYTQAGINQAVTQRLQIDSSGLTLAGTLFLRAGAAAAGSSPLTFTAGTNLTTAVNGAMEYNGTNLFFTRAGAVREGVLTQSAVTTEVIVSNTSITVNIGGTTYKLLARA